MAQRFIFLDSRFVHAAAAVALQVHGDVRVTELLQGRGDSFRKAVFKQPWKLGGTHFDASKVVGV